MHYLPELKSHILKYPPEQLGMWHCSKGHVHIAHTKTIEFYLQTKYVSQLTYWQEKKKKTARGASNSRNARDHKRGIALPSLYPFDTCRSSVKEVLQGGT